MDLSNAEKAIETDSSTVSGRSSRQSHNSIGKSNEKKSYNLNQNGKTSSLLLPMTTPKTSNRLSENFLVSLTGRIESGELYGINDIYCKYNFAYGPDWQITAGIEEGISQITTKDLNGKFVWNFPLEVTFKSSNPHGWPQLVVSLFGSDFLGNHVARGYGSTFIPITHDSTTKRIPLFVPESSSFIQKISSWIVGRRPEFIDPKLIAQGDGRQVVRVHSKGYIAVKFELVMKDFRKLGYISSSNRSSYDDSGVQ